MSFTVNSEVYAAKGRLLKLSHESKTTKSKMDVNVYLPGQYFETSSTKIPVLIYLSGLTCTPQNASEKGGIFFHADKYGVAIVLPDTSPKDLDIAGAKDSWDFGEAASFYLNSTKEPYATNYQMHSYVLQDLPLLGEQFKKLDFNNKSIFGFSMGGLGALHFYLRNNTAEKTEFQSVSAFAPIAHPSNCQWGKKAFNGYLQNESEWSEYDPTQLIKNYKGKVDNKILVHCGKGDQFYHDQQLQPESLVEASKGSPLDGKVELHMVEGFDHSYYFVSTFMAEHVAFHAKVLGLA